MKMKNEWQTFLDNIPNKKGGGGDKYENDE
jgi:hypothetical protein